MSNNFASVGGYVFSNLCGTGCPCRSNEYNTHLNLIKNPIGKKDHLPEEKYINVRGRIEHETIIRDESWCKELDLDQVYETIVYLERWGSWLRE